MVSDKYIRLSIYAIIIYSIVFVFTMLDAKSDDYIFFIKNYLLLLIFCGLVILFRIHAKNKDS